MLRRLEALLAVADKKSSLIISGNGDVIEPEEGIMAIGSGADYARSAAKALCDNTKFLARRYCLKKAYLLRQILCLY